MPTALQAMSPGDSLPPDVRLVSTYDVSSSTGSCRFGVLFGCCSSPACADVMAGDAALQCMIRVVCAVVLRGG
jgi:hypothetical protein